MPHVRKKVLPESMIYTDEYIVYDTPAKEGYRHDRVHHAEEIYVSGDAHTQTIDGFWSLLKRGIGASTTAYRPSTSRATWTNTRFVTITGETPAACSTPS